MSKVARFGVSVESELLDRFLRMAKKRGWHNRSEAVRNFMRDALAREQWDARAEIVGTITIVHDHHKRALADRLAKIQHEHRQSVLSTTHFHLDQDNCLEVVAVRGPAAIVRKIADALIGTRGIKHGKLAATTTGKRVT